MTKGGFNLWKWNFNSLKLQKLIAKLKIWFWNTELIVTTHADMG